MNDHIQVELRTLVERAVRPVRSSGSHKKQMREELLAHLTAVFEEELAGNPDESLALQRTAERFGDPRELTAQLQESASLVQQIRWRLESWWQVPIEAFTYRIAARFALRASLFAAALNLALLFPVVLFKQELEIWNSIALVVAIVLGIAGFTFGLLFLSLWMMHALIRRNWLSAVAIATMSGLLVPTIILALYAGLAFDLSLGARAAIDRLPMAMLLAPLTIFGMGWGFSNELRARREWAELAID